MPTLPEIRTALRAHRPRILPADGRQQAAVAMVLRGEPRRPEVLLIERAQRKGDPWSGHMAFPGGRLDPRDEHLRGAAERETHEEVGLALHGTDPLGRLDDLEGHHRGRAAGLVISAWVYHLPAPGPLVTNHEVEDTFWVPLARLRDQEHHVEFSYAPLADRRFQGIVVGEPERHVVWGLTYRFLEIFFDIVEKPLVRR